MKKWTAPSNSWRKTGSYEYKIDIIMTPSKFFPKGISPRFLKEFA